MRLVFPNYSHGTINLIASLQNYFGIKTHHHGLPILSKKLNLKIKNTIFMVLDGFGERILTRDYPQSWLNQHKIDVLTSVFPSTTSAAIPTFQSGLTPLEHGWLGWTLYFKETDRYVSPLPNIDGITGKPITINEIDSRNVIAYQTIFEQIHSASPQTNLYYLTSTKIGVTSPGPYTSLRASSFSEFTEQLKRIIQLPGEKYIYAYWPSPDYEMHHYGTKDPVTRGVIQDIDQSLAKLENELKGQSYQLIVSADHGHLDIEKIFFWDQFPDLNECCQIAPFIEPRCISFHLKKGMHEQFVERFEHHFGPYYLLLKKDEFLRTGWLGTGQVHPKIADFIGDYVAIATGRTYLHISAQKYEMKSHHAGITEDEMLVPLIVYSSQ